MLDSGAPPLGCHQSSFGATPDLRPAPSIPCAKRQAAASRLRQPEVAPAAGNLVLEKEAASTGPL